MGEKRGPYKFTDEVRDEYLDQLRNGSRRMTAARNIGLDPSTPRNYAREHPEFADQVRESELESYEQVEDALFMAASSGNVTACIFYLTNRQPDRWQDRRVPKVEMSGSVKVELSVDELRARAVSLIEDARAKHAKLAAPAALEAGAEPSG